MINDTHPLGNVTIYLKGETVGMVTQIVPLTIIVCGNETLEVVIEEQYDIVLKIDDPDFVIPWTKFDGIFKFDNQTTSNDICNNQTIQIFKYECNEKKIKENYCTEDKIFKRNDLVEIINH